MDGLFKVKHKKNKTIHTVYGSVEDSCFIYFMMYINGEWTYRNANDYVPVEDEEND